MADHGGSNQQRRSRHLWVGNVGAELSEEDIRRAFEPHGEILSIRLVRETSCCFVNFRNVDDAVVARQKLQRTVIPPGESKIEINFGKRQDNMTSRHLWVGNLESEMNDEQLKNLFAPFGQVLSVRLLRETNCGFVNFKTVEEAVAARTAMQGKRLSPDAKPIEIDFKFPRNQDGNGGGAPPGGGRRGEEGAGGGKGRGGGGGGRGKGKGGGNGQQGHGQGQGGGGRYGAAGPMASGVPDYDLVQPLPMVMPGGGPRGPPPPVVDPAFVHMPPQPHYMPQIPYDVGPRSPPPMAGPPPMALPQAWRPPPPMPPAPAYGPISPSSAAAVPPPAGPPPMPYGMPPPGAALPVSAAAAAATAALAAAAAASSTTSAPAVAPGGPEQPAPIAGPVQPELEMASSSTDWTVRVKAWRYWCQLFHRAESEDAQVMYAHADDCASQPLTFVQMFLQSNALEGAIDSVMRMPPDTDADLLLCLFSYCLEGDDAVHRRLLDGLCALANLLRQHGYSAFGSGAPNQGPTIARIMRMTVAAYKFDPMQVQKFATFFSNQLEDTNRRLAETERRLQQLDTASDAVAALLESTNLTSELLRLSKQKQQKMRSMLSRQTAFRSGRDIRALFEDIYKVLHDLLAPRKRGPDDAAGPNGAPAPDHDGPDAASPPPAAAAGEAAGPAPPGPHPDVEHAQSPAYRLILQRAREFVDSSCSTLLDIVEKRSTQWDGLMQSAQLQYLAYVERHMRQRREQLRLFQRRLRFCREKLETLERDRESMAEFGMADAEDETEGQMAAIQGRFEETKGKVKEVRTDMENVRFSVSVFLEANKAPEFAEVEARISELALCLREDDGSGGGAPGGGAATPPAR